VRCAIDVGHATAARGPGFRVLGRRVRRSAEVVESHVGEASRTVPTARRRCWAARTVLVWQPSTARARGDGGVDVIEPSGPMLGVLPRPTYRTCELTLAPGDTLLLYTDGLIEARLPDREQLGEDRLTEHLGSRAGATPAEVISGIRELLAELRVARDDDIALLALGPLVALGPLLALGPERR
jgi:hypothetical protein